MTPKEKAIELCKSMIEQTSKQCALIAVDEILEYNSIFNYKLSPLISETRRYWQEVKTEIEKL